MMDLTDDSLRVFQLSAQGFCCSQILVIMALEAEGKENPDLIRAMNGMCGGVGLSGKACGILVAGVCILSLYAGRGKEMDLRNEHFTRMIKGFAAWFEEEFESSECIDIVSYQVIGDAMEEVSYPVKCGDNLLKSFYKIAETLTEYGFEFGNRGER